MILVAALVLTLLSTEAPEAREALTISAASAGGWMGADWWFVDIKSTGEIRVIPQSASRPLVAGTRTMQELRALIAEDRLFDLGDTYGSLGVDSPFCRIRIQLGDRRKTIAIGDLADSTEDDKKKVLRVARLWRKIKTVAAIRDRVDQCTLLEP